MQSIAIFCLLVSVFFLEAVTTAFRSSTVTQTKHKLILVERQTQLQLVPGVETIGIAVISAAVGAASRQPQINELSEELVQARSALETSKEEMVIKISLLEDKLFQMDEAYETQSGKFIKEYEQRKKEEVAKIADKIKTDFKFKLDIEVEKEKSKLLTQKLTDVRVSGDQSAKLSEMKLQMNQLKDAKQKLRLALEKSESELKRIAVAGKKKNSFWPF